tara:strand:- start:97 stop:324 length:228 start_codon:yes stop_codon:yes gene_type:complete
VIDMVVSKQQAQKLKQLELDVVDIVNRVAQENAALQEITKEYLGEEMSEDILQKIVLQETLSEITKKLGGIFIGE